MKEIKKMAYSMDEAAELLGVSRPTLRMLVNQVEFPSFRVGKRRLISAEGLQHWMDKQVEMKKQDEASRSSPIEI